MSRRGNCLDNAAMESWLSTVKAELGETFEGSTLQMAAYGNTLREWIKPTPTCGMLAKVRSSLRRNIIHKQRRSRLVAFIESPLPSAN